MKEKHNPGRALVVGCNIHYFPSLGYENGLEMLYNHLPYGMENNSSVILANTEKEVLAVQWNEDAPTFEVIIVEAYSPHFFIYNNKKKIERHIYLNDFLELWMKGKKI